MSNRRKIRSKRIRRKLAKKALRCNAKQETLNMVGK